MVPGDEAEIEVTADEGQEELSFRISSPLGMVFSEGRAALAGGAS